MTPDFDVLNAEVARLSQVTAPDEPVMDAATQVEGMTYSVVCYTTADGVAGFVLVFSFADWVRVVNHGPEMFREHDWEQKTFGGIPLS